MFCAAISRSLQNNLPHPYLLLRIHNYGLLRVVLISLDLNLILLLHYTFVRVVVVIISHLWHAWPFVTSCSSLTVAFRQHSILNFPSIDVNRYVYFLIPHTRHRKLSAFRCDLVMYSQFNLHGSFGSRCESIKCSANRLRIVIILAHILKVSHYKLDNNIVHRKLVMLSTGYVHALILKIAPTLVLT